MNEVDDYLYGQMAQSLQDKRTLNISTDFHFASSASCWICVCVAVAPSSCSRACLFGTLSLIHISIIWIPNVEGVLEDESPSCPCSGNKLDCTEVLVSKDTILLLVVNPTNPNSTRPENTITM